MLLRKVLFGAAAVGMALAGAPGAAMADEVAHEFRIIKLGANPGTVIALGPLHGAGIETNTRHQVPLGQPFVVTFSFSHGDLYLQAIPGPPQINANPVSCVTRITLNSRTVVTGGTGAYAGATGTGSGTSNVTQIRGRADDGTCLPLMSPPIFELANVRATAFLTLP